MNDRVDGAVVTTLPGHPSMLRVMRVVAGRIADLAGLGYDRVEDLGLAVDEAGAVIMRETPGAITTAFLHAPGSVEFVMSGDGEAPAWPPEGWSDSIGRLVLESVADTVELVVEQEGAVSIRATVSAGGGT